MGEALAPPGAQAPRLRAKPFQARASFSAAATSATSDSADRRAKGKRERALGKVVGVGKVLGPVAELLGVELVQVHGAVVHPGADAHVVQGCP